MFFHRRLAACGFLLVAPLSSAFALDASTVGERLKSDLARQGTTLTFEGISGDAAQMIIEGATVSFVTNPNTFKIGDITLADIREESETITISAMSVPGLSWSQNEISLETGFISFTNVVLTQDPNDPLANIGKYDTFEARNVTISNSGRQIVVVDRFHTENYVQDDSRLRPFTGAIDRFSVDLSSLQDPASKKFIEALELQTMTGAFQLGGSWQPNDGRYILEKFDLSVDNLGALSIAVDLSGYTPDFMKSFLELQMAMANDREEKDDSARQLAMLNLLEQLTLHSASVRFDDNSLTRKLIAYSADQQNVTPEAVVNQTKALLPYVMASFGAPDLATQAIEAVNAYLVDPENLKISVEPQTPMLFSAIKTSAMSQSLNEVVKMLGVSVKANQPR